MIEPNIEDRMARIASGSVGGNPIDPDVSSILNRPATESMPVMTQTVEPSGTDPDVSDIVGRSNPIPLMSSLMSARQVDPAQAARAQTLAQQLGIGQDIALRNMGSVADRAFMAEINRRDIAVANPAVANLLAQRDFANLAHNDIDNLVETDRFWKQASGQSAISDSWLNQAVDWMTPDVFKASLTTGYARAAAQDEIKPMATAVYKRLLSGGTANGLSDSEEQQLRVRYRELNELQQSISGLESKASGWLTEPTYFASQMAMSLPNVARYAEMGAIVGGGIGAVGGVGILDWATIPVGMAAGATAGATTGFFMDSFESNAGEIYFQLRDKGYSRDQAYYTALTSGALIAAIDVGVLRYASRFTGSAVSKALGNAVMSQTMERFGLRAAEKAVTGTTAQAAKRTFGRAVAETGLEAAKATLAEAGGETLQDVVQYSAEVAAYNLTPEEMRKALESPESLANAASGWVDTFLKTAQGTWVFQIPGMAAHVTHARKQLRQAQRSAALIERVATLSDSSKLKQTSPQAYETAIETLAQGSGAETIYVDGGVARNMLMQANISGEQLDAIVPGLATQISEAAELGADVQIPISKFASSMAGTPIDSALRPYMRLSPSERTATEMQFESQLIRAMVEETEDASAAKIAKTREFAESAGQVQQKVFADLWNTGRYSRENARTNAVLAMRWYSTMAGRMGMTPGQLYEQVPYRTIRDAAEMPATVAPMSMAALSPEQVDTLTVATDAVEQELKSEGFTNVSEERFQFINDRIAGVRKAVKNNNVRDLESEAAMIREDIQKRGANAPMEKLAADVEARVEEAKGRRSQDPLEQASQFDPAGSRKLDTPEFKAWFRDSTMVNRDGSPQILYHGTERDFSEFRVGERARFGRGIYFADTAQIASHFGRVLYPVYLSIQNPLRTSDATWERDITKALGISVDEYLKQRDTLDVSAKLKERGYDGIVVGGRGNQIVVAFDPTDVKSVYNRGTWSRQTPNILEQANRDIIASVDAEIGSVMDAAKEASRAAGKSRSKDTQAAAHKAKRKWIVANPARYAEYQRAQEMERLENDRVREAAASALASKIDKSLKTAAKTLTDAGFVLDYESPAPSKSRYYRKGNTLIRLSDHEIPVTPERAAAREAGIQVPYRDFVFDGTNIDAELLQDLESFAARATPNILEQAARIDADYMAAVERGDMETAQRMVDEAAFEAGYDIAVEHQTNKLFTEFRAGEFGFHVGTGIPPGMLGQTTMKLRAKIENPLRIPDLGVWSAERVVYSLSEDMITDGQRAELLDEIPEEMRTGVPESEDMFAYYEALAPIREFLKDAGYDGIVYRNEAEGRNDSFIAFDPEQLKSAETVTRDEAGNVVPLSRRFDITSPRIFEQAQVPASFYSALGRAIDGIDIKSASASGWKERLKGLVNKGDIKQDELTWSGLEDWLSLPREGKITKDEVADFLKNNGVRVERVAMGSSPADLLELRNALARAEDAHDAARAREDAADRGNDEAEALAATEAANQTRRAVVRAELALKDAEKTKYAQYTLPGGTNYREVLLTLPRIPQDAFGRYLREMQDKYGENYVANMTEAESARLDELRKEPAGFRSQHWTQPNVVAHLRMNDRVDADGKRVLFVEEIQSDWAQAGRKRGFAQPLLKELPEGTLFFNKGEFELVPTAAVVQLPRNIDGRSLFYGETIEEATQAALSATKPGTVALAPFVETTEGWLNLALKQVMLEAVNGGYDRVAFVSGEQSANRYDLTKSVSVVSANKQADGRYWTYIEGIDGAPLFRNRNGFNEAGFKTMTADELEETVGKEIAQQLIEGKPNQQGWVDVRGDNLRVGGEGMKAFYDKIVPAAVNKLLKKVGGDRLGDMVLVGERRVTNDEIMAAERRGDFAEAERLTAIMERQELGRGESTAGQPIEQQQLGFDVTNAMREKVASGLPLFQAADAGARGGFDPSRLTTILNQKSDLSTWLHETAHFFMTAMSQMAAQPNATAEIRADMDEVLKWYGIAGATPERRLSNWNAMSVDGQRKYHEQWAYNFEIYLSEGKAPSVELQGVFDRFAAWLRGVYKSIRDDLNAIYRREFGSDLPILTGEVRQVMDRMLATEEQIKLAREVNMAKALFTGRPEGMSDAEWAAYQAMAEEDENAAIASMTQASMKSMEWLSGARSRLLKELQLKHDKTRKEVRDRLSKQARMEPVYRALAFFKTGKLENPDGTVVTSEKGYRLNKAGVMAILDAQQAMTGAPGKEVMLPTFIDPLKLPKVIMAEDGMDPAMAAEMLGFPSANQMLLAIANAKPLAEEVDARTDAEMVRTHSELATPEGREKEVQKALHVETRERMIGVELRFLAKATQPVRVFVEAAKRAAQEILGRRLVKDVNPSEFVAAEARAAREAGMSLESLQTAQEASERAYKGEYAKQVADGADAATADLRASGKARQAESEAQQRIDQFKAKYGDATPDQITIRATRQRLLQNQLAKLAISVRDEIDDGVRYMRKVMRDKNVKAMGADAADQIAGLLAAVDIRPMTLAESNRKAAFATWIQSQVNAGIEPDIDEELIREGFRTPYRNLTVEQFRNLVSAIEQIEYIGKNENKILAAKRKADFQAELDVINNNIRANAGKRKVLAREANTPMQAAKKKVVRFHASMLTAQTVVRILDGGRDGGPLWNYLIRPMNEAGDRRTEMVADATKKLTAIINPFLNTGAMTGQTLQFPGINRPLTLENRFVIALNMGNAGNIQRLLDGEGWTMDTIRPVLESLTEDQWNAVQEVWNFLETYRPMFAERERRLIGREPQWVEPQALTVKTADGKEVTLKGGYYPAKYDLDANAMSENLDAQQQAEQQMSAARMTPATQNGGLKKRAKQVKGRPVTLKLNALYSRVDEMIHDLCYREVIIDANRLMNSSFNSTVRETYGPEYARVLKDYIADVAVGERIPNDAVDMLVNFIRRGRSAASLGLNIFNTIQNLTGISNSWERIGGKWLLNGTMQFAAHPLTMIERVYEKSSLMKNRGRTSLMNLNEIRNMVEGQSSTMRQMEISTYFLQQQTQRVVDMCTWLGQYTKGLAEGHTEEQAVAMADQAVIDSQGSGMVKDLPSAMRGPGKKKILSMFYGFFNSTYNLLAAKHMTNKNLGELAATYFRVIIVPATISYILKQLLTPSIADDDKDAEQIAKELAAENLAYLMNTVLGVREFAQLSRTVFDAEDRPITYGGPVSFSAIGDGYRLINQIKQGELDAAFRRSMLNVLGWGTGLPTTQMNRTIDGITALYEGETTSPLAPVFGVRKH